MSWEPEQYLKYASERLRPALDLMARIDLAAPRSVVDLGCGAGNVTRILAQRWPHRPSAAHHAARRRTHLGQLDRRQPDPAAPHHL